MIHIKKKNPSGEMRIMYLNRINLIAGKIKKMSKYVKLVIMPLIINSRKKQHLSNINLIMMILLISINPAKNLNKNHNNLI